MPFMLAGLLVVGYLPGALIYRLPTADRPWRSARPAEERTFWAVMLSVALTSAVTLALAAAGAYRFERLIAIDLAVAIGILVWQRGRLRYGPEAPRPTATALVPVALVGLGLWLYTPPAEYLMGGRDPGVYMHQGIQLAQRGSLVTVDEVAAAVPRPSRPLFFPPSDHYRVRFMGFFITDLDRGAVVGQFPHLYPAWIAIGYGLDGLTGSRRAAGWWAMLGVVAVYFAGVRLVGRPAAAAGAGLLAINVVQVWFSRYPNSEVVMQGLLFAGGLAHAYAHEPPTEPDRRGAFFAIAAAGLLGLLLFTRFSAVLAVGAALGVSVLGPLRGDRRLVVTLVLPLCAFAGVALVYYVTILAPYMSRPMLYVANLPPMWIGAAAVAAIVLLAAAGRPDWNARLQRFVPPGLVAMVSLGALYAYFLREPRPGLAPQDAYALRQLAEFYLTPVGLAAGIVGYAVIVPRRFWANAGLVLIVTVFGLFYLYKMRIYPEHFWTARRFVPAILPALLLFAGGAAFAGPPARYPAVRVARVAGGVALCVFLAFQFWQRTQPVRPHVELAGLVPELERLAAAVGDDDLLLVESREASDVHVLGLPLAYTYARAVLQLYEARPDADALHGFVRWATRHHRRILFLGGGGTELVSDRLGATPVAETRFEVPEYDSTFLAYPRGARPKKFALGLYELHLHPAATDGFDLDVGGMDDVFLWRFHAKEVHANGATFRWSRDRSFVSLGGVTPDARTVTLTMTDGGRPPQADPARVTATLNTRPLGTVTVAPAVPEYAFEIPADLAAGLAPGARGMLQLSTTTWRPSEFIEGGDPRELGVIVDRIRVVRRDPAP